MVLSMRTVQLKLPSKTRRARPDFAELSPRFETATPGALALTSPFKIVR
jgi:hypothetical protein